MRYQRTELSWTQLILLIAFFVGIAIVLGSCREQAAKDCIAKGGQWVAITRDYHTCIGGDK